MKKTATQSLNTISSRRASTAQSTKDAVHTLTSLSSRRESETFSITEKKHALHSLNGLSSRRISATLSTQDSHFSHPSRLVEQHPLTQIISEEPSFKGSQEPAFKGTQESALKDITILEEYSSFIACGPEHMLAIEYGMDSSNLVVWGSNEHGQIGLPPDAHTGHQGKAERPTRIVIKYKEKTYFPVQVSCGLQHSAVLAFQERTDEATEDNNRSMENLMVDWSKSFVFCMGSNKNGCLGLGYASDSESEEESLHEIVLVQPHKHKNFHSNFIPSLGDLAGKVVRQVACGGNFTLALSEEGEVFAWGEGVTGALGTGLIQNEVAPRKIMLELLRSEDGTQYYEERARYIAAGYCHSLAVSQRGGLYAWGNNDFGQLGIVTEDMKKVPSSNLPLRLAPLKHPMDKVACGMFHSAAVSQDDLLFTWGANKNGQLGFLDFVNRLVPEQVTELKEESVKWVACGSNHTLVVTRAGKMYGFGNNSFNKLGCRDRKLKINKNLPPTKISLLPEDEHERLIGGEAVMQVATSSYCSIALTSDGSAFTWGKNLKGCLGRIVQDEISSKSNYYEEGGEEFTAFIPTQISDEVDTFKKFTFDRDIQTLSTKFTDVQCGLYHTIGLTNAGEVWVWGSNASGQHGLSNQAISDMFENCKKVKELDYSGELPWTVYPTLIPKFDIKANRRVTLICTGAEHILAADNNKRVYAWGKNTDGQLGLGRISSYVIEPESIEIFAGVPISCMAAGESHSLVVTKDGELYAFGSNKTGIAGLGAVANSQMSPKRVVFAENVKIEKVVCGPDHSLALDDRGKIYSWGYGLNGQLGHGLLEILYRPQAIDSKTKFIEISAGKVHSAAISEDKKLYIWGLKEAFLIYSEALEDAEFKGYTASLESELQKQEEAKRKMLKEKYFLTPTLWEYFSKEKITQVRLGDTFNALINEAKILYTWGQFETVLKVELNNRSRQLFKRKYDNLDEDEKYVVRKRLKKEVICVSKMNSCINLSLSPNHICLQTDGEELYSWGVDNFTGRLGLAFDKIFEPIHLKGNPEPLMDHYKSDVLNTYERVKWFIPKFKANKKELDKIGKFEEPKILDKLFRRGSLKKRAALVVASTVRSSKGKRNSINLERKLQEDLDDDENVDYENIHREQKFLDQLRTEERLRLDSKIQNLDLVLKQESAAVLEEFADLRDLDHSAYDFCKRLETVVFKRIARPPFGKTTTKKKENDLPEAYTLNKHLYKKLLTALQMHPCYLINMYDSTNIEALFEIIKEVYGDIEMDRRKTNMFIILSLNILKLELDKLDPKVAKIPPINSEEGEIEKSTPLFNKLFNHLVLSQRQNVQYLRRITDSIGSKVAASFQGKNFERHKFEYFLYMNPCKQGYKEFMERYKNESEETIKKVLKENAKNIRKKFGNDLFPLMLSPTKNISISVKYLFHRTIEEVTKKFQSHYNTKIITNCLLGLVFQYILNLDHYDVLRVKNPEDEIEQERIAIIRMSLEHVAPVMMRYIQGESFEKTEILSEFNNDINLKDSERTRILEGFERISGIECEDDPTIESHIYNIRDYNFHEYVVIDSFEHSLQDEGDKISVKLGTLEMLTKLISKNGPHIAVIKPFKLDITSLFLANLSPRANFVKNTCPKELTSFRVNLKLYTRQLLNKDFTLPKSCNSCGAILKESLLSADAEHILPEYYPDEPESLLMHFKKFMICLDKSTFVELLQQPIKRLDACIESVIANQYQDLRRQKEILKFRDMLHEHVIASGGFKGNGFKDRRPVSAEKLSELKYQECRKLYQQLKKREKEKEKTRTTIVEWIDLMDEIKRNAKQAILKRKSLEKLWPRVLEINEIGIGNHELARILVGDPYTMYYKIQASYTNCTNICKDIVGELDYEERKRLVVFGRYPFSVLKAKNILVRYKQKINSWRYSNHALIFSKKGSTIIIHVTVSYNKSRLDKLKRFLCMSQREEYEEIVAEYEVTEGQLMEWKKGKVFDSDFAGKMARELKSTPCKCCSKSDKSGKKLFIGGPDGLEFVKNKFVELVDYLENAPKLYANQCEFK